MNVTVEDYKKVLENFLNNLCRMENDIISVMQYGSAANGEIKPGKSDPIDAHVFLKRETLEYKDQFIHALDVMVNTYNQLAQSGLPFSHAFSYFSEDESHCLAEMFYETNKSENDTKIIMGKDIRSRIERGVPIPTLFFELRKRWCLPLTKYLYKDELMEEDCYQIITILKKLVIKYLPILVCQALGVKTIVSRATLEITKVLPDVDMDVFERIKDFFVASDSEIDREKLRGELKETLIFVEDLHDKLTTVWKEPVRT